MQRPHLQREVGSQRDRGSDPICGRAAQQHYRAHGVLLATGVDSALDGAGVVGFVVTFCARSTGVARSSTWLLRAPLLNLCARTARHAQLVLVLACARVAKRRCFGAT